MSPLNPKDFAKWLAEKQIFLPDEAQPLQQTQPATVDAAAEKLMDRISGLEARLEASERRAQDILANVDSMNHKQDNAVSDNLRTGRSEIPLQTKCNPKHGSRKYRVGA